MRLEARLGTVVEQLEPTQGYVVGRGSIADLRLDDPSVSRHHLDLLFDGEAWVAIDRSSAGSFVGEEPFERLVVREPTTISLGPPGGPTIELLPLVEPRLSSVPAIDVGDERSQFGTIALTDEALRLDLDDQHYAFAPGTGVVVGRDDDCDVISDDRLVSRKHCVFEHDGTQWMIEDLGSTRGTFIDGRRVSGRRPIGGAFLVGLGDRHAGAQLRVVTAGEHEIPAERRPVLLAGAALIVGLLAVGLALFAGNDVLTPEVQPLAAPIEVVVAETSDPLVPAAVLAPSIVQLVATFENGQVCGTGSGTYVGDGLILTNFHVIGVTPFESPDCRFRGDIAIAAAPDRPAVVSATASIVAVDAAADLAVLRLDEDLGLPAIELSIDQPAIGSRIRIFGFPGIGGDTLTVTSGQVSGFLDDVNIGPGAWIKTDATVAGGNSGGAALDDAGRLVGVPTIVGASETTKKVECRALADTNADGVIDDSDTCVSVGGFLNGLRPARYASELLAAAATAAPIPLDDPALDLNLVDQNANFAAIRIEGMRIDGFSADGGSVGPDGPEILCATYEYSGTEDGVAFQSGWVWNEEFLYGAAAFGFWGGGASGQTTTCYRPLGGIPPGDYIFYIGFGLDADVVFEVQAEIE